MLIFHALFALISFASFVGKTLLSEFKPELLEQHQKIVKIAPHIIDTLLLLSGIILVIKGSWLSAEYGWIVTKLLLLVAYIGLGVFAMRSSGARRWQAFGAAVACYVYIIVIAITKNGWF